MKRIFALLLVAACLWPVSSFAAERPNVLLICVDDLRPELGCYGVSYIHSPNIDRLASTGRIFLHNYVQAPTCGASRFTLLTGRYGGASNNAIFQRAAKIRQDPDAVPPSMPAWFRTHGYTTVSIGKVSHHPGGMGGPDWNDPNELEMPFSWDRHLLPAGPWQHPRGWMHGLANGEIRGDASKMDVFQAVDGPDAIYPDGVMIPEALKQLEELAQDNKPFFLAVGILRPHLPFGCPAKYYKLYENVDLPPIPHPEKPDWRTTWHGSGEFMKYHRWNRDPRTDTEFADLVRKHYAACVSYADAQVGRVLETLEKTGEADKTIVVLWGDHGWHLGEHAIWGKHSLFEESLRSPLMIRYPGIPKPGETTEAVVETLDLFPTLCDLAGLPMPEFVHGVSLRPILEDPKAEGHPAVSYQSGRASLRTARYHLVLYNDGYAELYDHATDPGETKNIAEAHPEIVKELADVLNARLALRD
ncbi:MAG: iduronate-2-sulfatase [Planctomycetota bacterium]|nr:MAG: iduronate-2-sulfatase [Planctomycetota bacterium]